MLNNRIIRSYICSLQNFFLYTFTKFYKYYILLQNFVRDSKILFIKQLTKKDWNITNYNEKVLKLTLTEDNGKVTNILVPKEQDKDIICKSQYFMFIDNNGDLFSYPQKMKILIQSNMFENDEIFIYDIATKNKIDISNNIEQSIVNHYDE